VTAALSNSQASTARDDNTYSVAASDLYARRFQTTALSVTDGRYSILVTRPMFQPAFTSTNAIIYDHYLVTISCLVIEVLFVVTKKIFGHRKLFFL
jgi:hypothetical protein